MIVLSTILGASAGLLGMYVSYWLDVSSGATIVLLEAAGFAVVSLVGIALNRQPEWTQAGISRLAAERPADDFG